MLYGLINEDGTVTETFDRNEFTAIHSNTLFPTDITDAMARDFGFARIEPNIAPVELVQDSGNKFNMTIDLVDEVYVRTWNLVTLPAEEQQVRFDRKMGEVRSKRNELLTSSDYTQTSDYHLLSEEWKAYRKELRDLPNAGIDPYLIEFPEVPSVEASEDLELHRAYVKAIVGADLRVQELELTADTGLGYFVAAGYEDFLKFGIAKDLDLTVIKDVGGSDQTLEVGDIDTILQAIRTTGITLMQTKWTKLAAIEAASTIVELDAV